MYIILSELGWGENWKYATFGLSLTVGVAACLMFLVVLPAFLEVAKWMRHELVCTKFGPKMFWSAMVPVLARLATTQLPRDWRVTVSPVVDFQQVVGMFALAHFVCLLSAWVKTSFRGFSFNNFARKSATIYGIEGIAYIMMLGSSVPSLFFHNHVFEVVYHSVFNMTLPWLAILLLHCCTARFFMKHLYSNFHAPTKEVYAGIV